MSRAYAGREHNRTDRYWVILEDNTAAITVAVADVLGLMTAKQPNHARPEIEDPRRKLRKRIVRSVRA